MKRMMKTGISLGILAFALSTGLTANAQTAKKQVELPAIAQTFITNNFKGQSIQTLSMDKDMRSTEYDVILTNGISFEFDESGNWEEIDGNKTALPTSVLPGNIADYVAKNYVGKNVLKIEKNKRKYEVELSDGTELEFDTSGKFMKID